MKYKLENKPEFLVAGKSVETSENEIAAGSISAFWADCNENGTCDELNRLMKPHVIGDALLGVCCDMQEDGSFQYIAGAEVASEPQEAGLKTIKIPAAQWMIFESVGPLPKAIQDIWQKINFEVLPASGYRHADAPDLEVYYDGNMTGANYRCEVWIPVV